MLMYRLQSLIPLIFASYQAMKKLTKKEIFSKILSYKFEGAMSLDEMSTIMKREGLEYSGKSTISQSLSAIGALIPSIESIPLDESFDITVVLDEIFIGSQPILIIVEPISSMILNIKLSDNRDSKTWEESILYPIQNRNINIFNAITDDAKGIISGIKNSLPNATRRPDTFHALSHRLGIWVSRLETQAYRAINSEYERELVCLNRKTDKSFKEKEELYKKARIKAIEAIELYENFNYLYKHTINQLNPFKSNGELRDMIKAREEIEVALELIETLENKNINKEIVRIRKVLPDLLDYFNDAQKAIENCKSLGVDDEAIRTLSLEWQWNKDWIKAKASKRKKRAKEKIEFYSSKAKDILDDDYEIVKEQVFNELETIIQASSMVENINSLLRPYLDRSKNQVTQEFLNLFAFYHNHRVYQRGKRAGKAPIEIFTNKKQDKDWIELLIERVESKEADFFL